MDIFDQIDRAMGCQQCGGPLGTSPSNDFCSQRCQEDWHAARAERLEPYREVGHDFWEDAVRFNAPVPSDNDAGLLQHLGGCYEWWGAAWSEISRALARFSTEAVSLGEVFDRLFASCGVLDHQDVPEPLASGRQPERRQVEVPPLDTYARRGPEASVVVFDDPPPASTFNVPTGVVYAYDGREWKQIGTTSAATTDVSSGPWNPTSTS